VSRNSNSFEKKKKKKKSDEVIKESKLTDEMLNGGVPPKKSGSGGISSNNTGTDTLSTPKRQRSSIIGRRMSQYALEEAEIPHSSPSNIEKKIGRRGSVESKSEVMVDDGQIRRKVSMKPDIEVINKMRANKKITSSVAKSIPRKSFSAVNVSRRSINKSLSRRNSMLATYVLSFFLSFFTQTNTLNTCSQI